ncbi:MAG: thioesterase family protein, partial [Ilumatobacteraceae bacterium]
CSVHASFLSSGRGGEPIRYEVERTRDGASFGTRRVVVRQDHGVVLVATIDYHDDEDGEEYSRPSPVGLVPDPEQCPTGRYVSPWFRCLDVPPEASRSLGSHTRCSWFEPRQPADGPMPFHLAAIAYVSDHGPTRAAREPHTGLHTDGARMSVSLDHSVWLHRPARIDQWLLLELAPVATGHARGLAMGHLWTRSGELVATIAQEVLLRTL